MEIIITGWDLDSYLELKHEGVFSEEEYKDTIRPDALLLKNYPDNPKFENDKFWSIATDRTGKKIKDGYKMKWHQIGNGKVQLRLTVGIFDDAFLCEAYVKRDESYERRKLAKFNTRLELIRRGTYAENGRLS